MQERKYWVPALEKADAVIRLIAAEPARHKLSDLCKRLGISKSSMFSLLATMEALGWVTRDMKESYSLGLHFGMMGSAFFERYNLIEWFHQEAAKTVQSLGESVQLARLEGKDVLYLAKATSSSLVQMVSGPGARFPAHATGLGKVMLASLDDDELNRMFPEEELPKLTVNTIATKTELLRELEAIRRQGYAFDMQEGVMGFNCVAAPIMMQDGKTAAISASMPVHSWADKKEAALEEIRALAGKLTLRSHTDIEER